MSLFWTKTELVKYDLSISCRAQQLVYGISKWQLPTLFQRTKSRVHEQRCKWCFETKL